MSTKDYSSIQERCVSNALGWEVVTGSGARPCVPGDVRSDEWLGECKTHTEPYHKITFMLTVWDKIQHEADTSHRSPALIVDDGSQKLSRTWVLCRLISVDRTRLTIHDPNFKVTKNISFDHQVVTDYLKSLYTVDDGSLNSPCIGISWNNQQVVVMPFSTFQMVKDR